VLATDISEGVIELARQVARERGFEQIETRAMDGEKLDLPDASFDAVLCRLGLMYMPHPVTALREWRQAGFADTEVRAVPVPHGAAGRRGYEVIARTRLRGDQ